MRVALGNRHAVQGVAKGDEIERVELPRGKRATVCEIPDDWSIGQAFTAITSPSGVWAAHAREGATPAWVASDSAGLAALLSEHWGGVEVRDYEEESK